MATSAANSASAVTSWLGVKEMCGLVIVALRILRYGQPTYLAAGYLRKFGFPAFTWLGDEKEDQAVPQFAESVVCHALSHVRQSYASRKLRN
jgi:hypothetical protein